MRVVLLAPYPPFPPHGGGQQRMYHVIRHLAKQHEVHLLTFVPNGTAAADLAPLRHYCDVSTVPMPQRSPLQRLGTTLSSRWPDMLWRGRSTAFADTLQHLLQRVPCDVVQAESIEMTQYAPPRQRRASSGPLWVYDAFNVEYTLQQRAFQTDLRQPRQWPQAGYSLLQWQKLRRYEQHLHQRFGGAFAVSQPDQQTFARLDPQLATVVVPNGVDTTYFTPAHDAEAQPQVLFTGTLDFRPNVDAVRWFADAVWPHILAQQPQAQFVVVGRNPLPAVQALATRQGIRIVGAVPDVRPFFGQAAVYVVPMRVGGGVRLKVLEAWAQGLPVVSTTLGLEGIEGFEVGTHGLVADAPPAFAADVVRLLEHRAWAQQLGTAARHLVQTHYDWAMIVPGMTHAWEQWLDQPQP